MAYPRPSQKSVDASPDARVTSACRVRDALRCRVLPSRPLAGRVERGGEAAERGVGGLRLLGICGERQNACSEQAAPPTPNPSPPLASLAGGGEQKAP